MSKKMFFLAFLLSANFAFSQQLVNGLAAIVENEPITMYEVYKTSQILKTDEKSAINFLIKDRLEQAQIKALNIDASSFEINERMQKIAQENGVNLADLSSVLSRQGINYSDFKEDVAKSIKQEKLYQNIFKDAKVNVSEEGARAYFEQNPSQFVKFAEVKATRYISGQRELLESIQDSPLSVNPAVKTEILELKSEQIPPQLRQIFEMTKDGSFTQIFQTPSGFEMFLVSSKSGVTMPRFEDVKNEVMNSIYRLEEERVISEYFNKLRARANIKMLR
ncbi:peptidyl-prolyl cis-trans isomerase [Campylobacter sp. CCUG 57310]|uniref:peptidylprolyl isomerase n=1 Tax=Campylobacter sp. CCUG 57310 TaxID=2517362 RepID=UPI0015652A55|nr:peptidyl-prolyl cis-trans isomerase [Campylobacter sp. CCUG 57310]QKF91417.1 putative chaperone (SurA domain) [Campylobacter sp. CCUG 57310]